MVSLASRGCTSSFGSWMYSIHTLKLVDFGIAASLMASAFTICCISGPVNGFHSFGLGASARAHVLFVGIAVSKSKIILGEEMKIDNLITEHYHSLWVDLEKDVDFDD